MTQPPTTPDVPTAAQEARLANVPGIYKTNHERLAYELALKIDSADEIFARYHYTPEQALDLVTTPAFAALLDKVTTEVRENGLSFRIKARAIAEDLLPHAYEMATDPFTSAAVRADIIQWAAKVADLEPRKDKDDGKGGGGLTLNIQFSGAQPQAVLSREPVTIEG